ncbi:MAG: response regulator [Verrucomicrobiota bacterium]
MQPDPIHSSCQTLPPQDGPTPVLLLEDDVSLAGMLKIYLGREGFQVTAVHLGQEALRLLRVQQFRLAMVDIDLPDTTGFQVMNQANENGWLGSTKIIFCSGNTSEERLAMASQFRNSIFVEKPFDPPSLSTRLRFLMTCK